MEESNKQGGKDRREAYKNTLFAFTLSLVLLPLKHLQNFFSSFCQNITCNKVSFSSSFYS
jgi:hypothetical protein